MNVLIFGGTRYMGKHLVRQLLSKSYAVTIATRGITPDDFGNRVTRLIVDRTDLEALRKTLANQCYDVVFDSLAYCSNDVKSLLETVQCSRYIQTSSISVYGSLQMDTHEESFDPSTKQLVWCDRSESTYDEVKRQAECAIVQNYSHIPSVMVRFPFVIGEDDYTKRLSFYIDHIVHQKPMLVNGYESQIAFVRSDEAGKFLAFLGENNYCGTINGASEETISMEEVAEYVKMKTGKTALLSEDGEAAPYNSVDGFSINIDRAKALGFGFTPLKSWIYQLIDTLIEKAGRET